MACMCRTSGQTCFNSPSVLLLNISPPAKNEPLIKYKAFMNQQFIIQFNDTFCSHAFGHEIYGITITLNELLFLHEQ